MLPHRYSSLALMCLCSTRLPFDILLDKSPSRAVLCSMCCARSKCRKTTAIVACSYCTMSRGSFTKTTITALVSVTIRTIRSKTSWTRSESPHLTFRTHAQNVTLYSLCRENASRARAFEATFSLWGADSILAACTYALHLTVMATARWHALYDRECRSKKKSRLSCMPRTISG